ncbi:hypothetical protein EON83_03765 [bacterium]|nr:MAG: hypothetical protein EON83_03765 [bacterium]
MPNPSRFTPIDLFPSGVASTLPISLQIGSPQINYKSLLIRLLVGSMGFQCTLTNKTIRQRNNYSNLTYTTNVRANVGLIQSAFTCSIQDLGSHLTAHQNHNRNFYKEIFHEYCNFFYYSHNGHHQSAFLHLYRIIERMAYCLPLIWAAKAQGYERTFNKLRSYFTEARIGELAVLKNFIHDFIDSSLTSIHVNFYIQSSHHDWQRSYYNAILSTIQQNRLLSASPYSTIEIYSEDILDVAIKIRNKYFHALTGSADNFTSENIIDGNEFFYIINQNVANWIALILFQIFEHEMK